MSLLVMKCIDAVYDIPSRISALVIALILDGVLVQEYAVVVSNKLADLNHLMN